jgi:hypothetical protein
MPPSQEKPVFLQNTAIMISREIDAVYERVIISLEKLGLIQRSAQTKNYFYIAKPLRSLPKEQLPFPHELTDSNDLELSFKDLPGGFQSLEFKWSCPKIFSHHKDASKEVQQITLIPSYTKKDRYASFDWVHITFDSKGNIIEILNDKFDTILNPTFNGMTEKKWLEQHDPLLRSIVGTCATAADQVENRSWIDKLVDLFTEELKF